MFQESPQEIVIVIVYYGSTPFHLLLLPRHVNSGLHTSYFHTSSDPIQQYLFCGQPFGCRLGEVFTLGSSEVLTTLALRFGQLSSNICIPTQADS
jgi:hypothetical protein